MQKVDESKGTDPMRIGLTFIGVCLSCPLGAFAADQALPLDRSLIDARTPDVEVVLGEAAEILLKQPELPHSFWICLLYTSPSPRD